MTRALAGPPTQNRFSTRFELATRGHSALYDKEGRSQLISCIVGDTGSILKSAGRIARLLEEQFIVDGWPVGRIYGCESELAQRFGVGRAIIRETARILEARGTARMRRGRHGGLALLAPAVTSLEDMLCGYSHLVGVSRSHVRSARLVLNRVCAYMATERAAHIEFLPLLDRGVMDSPALEVTLQRLLSTAAGNAVVAFYSDCLERVSSVDLPEGDLTDAAGVRTGSMTRAVDHLVSAMSRRDLRAAAAWAGACSRRSAQPPLQPSPSDREAAKTIAEHRSGKHGRDTFRRTRAGQIVHNLIRQVEPGGWTDGRVLGNEPELCEHYEVDRGVLRQAIRILEAAETAATVPGRGHGLVARSPGPASISRLICCHFAANRVGYHQPLQVFKWLGVELMALAARRATSASLAPINEALAALSGRKDAVLLSDLIEIEEQQFSLAGNPLLDLFLRSAKAFPSWSMLGNLPVSDGALHDFLDSSIEVAAAIAARQPDAAARAQERKFVRLNRHLDHIFTTFRSGSMQLSVPTPKPDA